MSSSSSAYSQSGPTEKKELKLESYDGSEEETHKAGKSPKRSGGVQPPLESRFQPESKDRPPQVRINLLYCPELVSKSPENRFARDKLFDAVSSGDPQRLDGLYEYLHKTSKFLTDSLYTDAKTDKTCLMKALLNLKDGTTDIIKRLLEIDQELRSVNSPRDRDLLVNAECTGYYEGQTALHIAIEKRNLELVKLLVEKKADVHTKACGEFFRRKKGGVGFYFGELPLSLAVCTNQPDVIDYLLDNPYQPARLQEQDSLGNTVLHALVMVADDTKEKENTELVIRMYDQMLKASVKRSNGWKLEEIVNKQGFTPLKLAAKTGKVEIFKHIIQREMPEPAHQCLSRKFTEWTYGPIQVSLYDLSSIDSYEKNSVLEILAYSSDTPNRDKMVDLEPLNKLLQDKWDSFAARRFYLSFFFYVVFMVIFTFVACHQPLQGKPLFPVDFNAGGPLQITAQIIVLFGGIYLIFTQCLYLWRRRRSLRSVFSDDIIQVFLLFQSLSLLLAALLYAANLEVYVIFLVLALLLGWVNMLYYTRGFQLTGMYSIMIQKIILRDLLRFIMVYVIFLFGFSTALVALTGGAPRPAQNESVPQEGDDKGRVVYGGVLITSLELFKFTIGMGDLEFREHTKFKYFVMLLLLLYVILTYILLLNMLIALMNDTVSKVTETSESAWKLQRAIAILEIENTWLWRWKQKPRSGFLCSVGPDKKEDERWCFRVEESYWDDWKKNLVVLKEDPGNCTESESKSQEKTLQKRPSRARKTSTTVEEQMPLADRGLLADL
uniref:Transient receptor potential cation channel subfamily V member 2 n=1 Tax=Sphenodon punctatus TaxID=8508 RepID=A0A8D0L3G8_SPHPU